MKTKELLYEWKRYLDKDLLNEASFEQLSNTFPEFSQNLDSHPQFNTAIKKNAVFMDIIKNTLDANQAHGPDEFIGQFEYFKTLMLMQHQDPNNLVVDVPGEDEPVSLVDMLNPRNATATLDDILRFRSARLSVGKGSKNKTIAYYLNILVNHEQHFDVVLDNSDWFICYPKTVSGSKALCRSYWKDDHLEYDTTYKISSGTGKYLGRMSWCTNSDGENNMFINYHRRLNLHMYYCIKKKTSSSEADRKLCLSFGKVEGKVYFAGDKISTSSCVDGNNIAIKEEEFVKYLGRYAYETLFNETKKPEVLEVNLEDYYTSISLSQYETMRAANEANIEDFEVELENILKNSKDKDKILVSACNDSNTTVRFIAASSNNISTNEIKLLANDTDLRVRCAITENSECPSSVLLFLVNDRQPVRCNIAKNLNSSHEVLDILSKDKDENVRSLVLRNANLRIETFIALFDKTYPSWEKGGDKTFLKSARDYMIVLNNNTSRETIEKALVNAISIDERKATRSPFISHHSKNDIIGAGIGHKNFNLDFIDELKSKTADERLLFSIDLGAINSDQCTKVLYEQASQRYIERSRRKIYLSHGTVDEIVEFIECTFAQKHPEDARSVLSRWRLGLQKIKEIYFKDYIHHDEDDHTTEEEVLRDMHEEHPHLKTLFREDIVSDSLLRQYIKVLLN